MLMKNVDGDFINMNLVKKISIVQERHSHSSWEVIAIFPEDDEEVMGIFDTRECAEAIAFTIKIGMDKV